MKTARQPSALPTNKLIASAITSAVVAVVGRILQQYAPAFAVPEVFDLIGIMAGLAVAWFVKDRPNTPSE